MSLIFIGKISIYKIIYKKLQNHKYYLKNNNFQSKFKNFNKNKKILI
jgi:hypothetical protein